MGHMANPGEERLRAGSPRVLVSMMAGSKNCWICSVLGEVVNKHAISLLESFCAVSPCTVFGCAL